MTISPRGVISLTLAGQTLELRPSYAALASAEQELGPLFALIERAGAGSATLAEMTGLLWHCAQPAPPGLDRERFGEALVEAGLLTATGAFRAVLEVALGGGRP